MNWKDHIVVNPDILVGKPIVKGTRISVEHLLGCFASGWSYAQILDSYPHLKREQVEAAMMFAVEVFRASRAVAVERITQPVRPEPEDDG